MRRICATVVLALGCARLAHGLYAEPVQARIVVSAPEAAAGEALALGVLFRIQPGWHIYWLNPGDAGLPTSVRWTVPPGFQVGRLQWPVPARFEQPGGAVGFGYAGSVLLASRLTPPASGVAGRVAIGAEVGWLACEKICVRGTKRLDLMLAPDAPAGAVDPSLFADWSQRVPVDPGSPGAPASVALRGGIPRDGRLGTVRATLTWAHPPALVEWFPPDDPALAARSTRSWTDGDTTRLLLRAKRVSGEEPRQPTLESVVAWTDADGRRHGLRVPIPLDGKET